MCGSLVAFIGLTLVSSLQNEASAASPLRIINGTTAVETEFPYMVQLRFSDGLFECGGSILAPEWILTAAHCVELGSIGLIVYGTTQYQFDVNSSNTSIKVKNYFSHPNFTHVTDQSVPIYDVGLLQLEEPIPFSEYAQPIKIAEENADIPVHTDGVLTGWGVVDAYWTSPQYLQKIILQFLTDDECSKNIDGFVNETIFLPTHHLCTNDDHNGENSGDSGSPFVVNNTQYGISSWSVYPGMVSGAFTRITNPDYRRWIKNISGV